MYIYDNHGNPQNIEIKEKYEDPNHPTNSYQENFTQPSHPETRENFDSSSPNYNLYVGLIVGGVVLVIALSVGAWMWKTKKGPFALSSAGSSVENMSSGSLPSALSSSAVDSTPMSLSDNPVRANFGFRFY